MYLLTRKGYFPRLQAFPTASPINGIGPCICLCADGRGCLPRHYWRGVLKCWCQSIAANFSRAARGDHHQLASGAATKVGRFQP